MTDAPSLVLPDWAVVTPPRRAHIARVVSLVETWAGALGVAAAEADRWRRAAALHDALRDAGSEVLGRYCPQGSWAEGMWHGPAAASAAAAHGETDVGVINAIRYHSVGFAGWDEAGRMLFLADALEPGRRNDRAELDALQARVPVDPAGVLRELVARRIAWLARTGRPLVRETWEFWNSLAAAGSRSSLA